MPQNFPTHIVAAAGYVFDNHGNILMIKTHNRGWDCTGGQIENGESLEDGVLREIMEESGVTALVRCLAGVYSNVGTSTWPDGTYVSTKIMFDFICDYVVGEPRPSCENSETVWMPKDTVMYHVTQDVLRLRFANVLAFDGRVKYCSYVTKPEFKLLSERYI